MVESHLDGSRDKLAIQARLALITAISSYQVGDDLIGEFREIDPDDAAQLGTVAWAALVASLRIAEWLGKPFQFKSQEILPNVANA